jgi:amino acid kinase family protein
MTQLEVLKFGSSVLGTAGDLHVAVDEIYRRWRSGSRVIAVVSAFEGITDALMNEVTSAIGVDCPEATAAYVATGEERTAALLLGSLHRTIDSAQGFALRLQTIPVISCRTPQ